MTDVEIVAAAIRLIGATALARRLNVALRSLYSWAEGDKRRPVPPNIPAELRVILTEHVGDAQAILRAIDALEQEKTTNG